MVAIAVTRLGGKSVFVGKLGDDDFGNMLAGILEQNGVQACGINFDAGARTINSRGGQNFTDRRIWNYFSIRMDSQVPYAFHSKRKLHPEKFKHQLVHQKT